jgi:hypothetical protein
MYSRQPTQMVTNNQEGNNCKGGKNNNKAKDNTNNDRSNNNAGEGKKEKRKVKFPCKLCKYDHLTHLCPKIEESSRLLSQSPIVLKNPFPHNQHMASGPPTPKMCRARVKTPQHMKVAIYVSIWSSLRLM